MARVSLTDARIRALKPAPPHQRYEVLDAIVPGLIVRVTDTGKRTLMLKTRFPGSRHPTRRAIGEYGAITLDAARDKARAWHELIRRGIDPADEEARLLREQERTRINTFAKIAEDYIARQVVGRDYARLIAKAEELVQASSSKLRRFQALAKVIQDPANQAKPLQRKAAVVIRELDREFISAWGDRPITDITAHDVVTVIDAAVQRGAEYQAHNLLGHVRRLFNWAIGRNIYGLDRSPCDRMRPKDVICAPAELKAEGSMQIRKLRMGWDVGAWHCDRNSKSRDALVVLEAAGAVPQPRGKWWRGNLRSELTTLRGAPLIRGMLALCGLQETGPLDLTIAIDTPLGWPQAMLRLAYGGEPTQVPENDEINPYTRRATEVELVKRGDRPLSPVRDMLGSQSTKGIHFLRAAGLQLSSCGVWASKQNGLSVKAIETYPAAARKHPTVLKQFEQMLAQPPFQSLASSVRKDVEDALICGLIAHFFSDLSSKVERVPPCAPKLEGWIIMPRNNGTVK